MLCDVCRHRHPHHCCPTPPQPHQRRNHHSLAPVLLPTCDPPPPRRLVPALSALSIAHGAIFDWHAASTPSGTARRVPIPPVPPLSKDGPIVPAPPSRPPRCIGLLSGGQSWTLLHFSGRHCRSGDGDGSMLMLTLNPSASGTARCGVCNYELDGDVRWVVFLVCFSVVWWCVAIQSE